MASHGPEISAHSESTNAIQTALRKALKWNQALLDGKAETLTEIAQKENVEQRYICDLIKIAYLSPDIIEAISKGEIPVGLTLDRLKKGFSPVWGVQQQELGFNNPLSVLTHT